MPVQDSTHARSTTEILLQQNILGVQICQHKMVSSFILAMSSYYCNTDLISSLFIFLILLL